MLELLHKKNHHPTLKQKLTLGQRLADEVTKLVGSWEFIIFLSLFLLLWITLNIYLIGYQRWDPYPFILLNLALSCLATYQAPVILMSQNRTAERDRIFAKYDYQVNRKAEREVTNMQKDLDQIKRMLQELRRKKK